MIASWDIIEHGAGIFQDSNGFWLSGFLVNIENCSLEEAEFWVLCNHPLLFWQKGYINILLKLDCAKVIRWLTEDVGICSSPANCVAVCMISLIDSTGIVLQNVHNGGNHMADLLAHEAKNYGRGLHVFQVILESLEEILEDDYGMMSFMRRVPVFGLWWTWISPLGYHPSLWKNKGIRVHEV